MPLIRGEISEWREACFSEIDHSMSMYDELRERSGRRVMARTKEWKLVWFMDERAIVHDGKLIVGSVRAVGDFRSGRDDPNWGNVELAVHDIDRGTTDRVVLDPHFEQDDHDGPALLADAAMDLRGLRPSLFPVQVEGDWDELRRFRHFLRHAYPLELDPQRLSQNVERLARAVAEANAPLRAAVLVVMPRPSPASTSGTKSAGRQTPKRALILE